MPPTFSLTHQAPACPRSAVPLPLPTSPEKALSNLYMLRQGDQSANALPNPSTWSEDIQHSTYGSQAQQQFNHLLYPAQPRSLPLDGLFSFHSNLSGNDSRKRKREHSVGDDETRPGRKTTKRRRTGPDRFRNYPHGDTDLPLDATTTTVFSKYPNHIFDKDYEELWRLGNSARYISDLMPLDTHFNSDGEEIQQHHSLIQKKFRKFYDKYVENKKAMEEDTGHMLGSSPIPAAALPSTLSDIKDLPKLKFRCYPFHAGEDHAFEARMSIELAPILRFAGHPVHSDHEVRILRALVGHECRQHVELLKQQILLRHNTMTAQTSVPNNVFWQRVDQELAQRYGTVTSNLAIQWSIPYAGSTTSKEALRQLYLMLQHIFQTQPFATLAPAARRPLFNFVHVDLLTWRTFARMVYYLTEITQKLTRSSASMLASLNKASSHERMIAHGQDLSEGQPYHVNAGTVAYIASIGPLARGPSTRPYNSPSPFEANKAETAAGRRLANTRSDLTVRGSSSSMSNLHVNTHHDPNESRTLSGPQKWLEDGLVFTVDSAQAPSANLPRADLSSIIGSPAHVTSRQDSRTNTPASLMIKSPATPRLEESAGSAFDVAFNIEDYISFPAEQAENPTDQDADGGGYDGGFLAQKMGAWAQQ